MTSLDESSDNEMLSSRGDEETFQLAQNSPPTQMHEETQASQEETATLMRLAAARARRHYVPPRVSVDPSQTQDTIIASQEDAFAALETFLQQEGVNTQNNYGRSQVLGRSVASAPARNNACAPASTRKRGPNITGDEVLSLLDTIQDLVPLGALQWARVATKHESNGYPNRSADVLKRRYQGLLKKANQVPTGNPHLPEEIKRVREVQAALRTAARAADPSQENGGVSAMFHGTNVVTSENAGTQGPRIPGSRHWRTTGSPTLNLPDRP